MPTSVKFANVLSFEDEETISAFMREGTEEAIDDKVPNFTGCVGKIL